ncbi:Protein lin-10 [Caenorhabditis elegans]|uniref:Protein lin-10 n=2 Tax=Caenorhabditis elegans TaxID=6239 RepID=LIN10_CAEEL|nr:Protein lin-10 [Caenorhabditis elegans]O17583.1 RecName: Full=Protein lin-10; AltName: Full=Abnormal cell lineage protein 10 [Caenorhabditis elegans]CAB03869.1 Protein lin-10 [Caenorhabditis elegans]|eukprot:NP_492226.2 Protein lin-10 [Caenorhabditis elegans]
MSSEAVAQATAATTSPEHGVPTSSATPTPPPSKGGGAGGGGGGEQQQVPFQMIPPGHFFANPFLNPYIPTAGAPAQEGEAQPQMVFSPAQYQEVMHHYFQQMMAASGAQFPIPFPMQFQPALQQPRPSSQASSSHRSEDDNGRQTAGSVVSSNVSPNHREVRPAEDSTETSGVVQNNDELLVPTSTSSDVTIGDVIEKSDSPENSQESAGGEEKSEEKRKLSGDRTDSLIRKQMSEMEKEITRRSQNKNIKTIDDDGLAELIGGSSTRTVADDFSPFVDKSGLSYTAPAPPSTEKSAPKESLNQLRSSFNLPDDSTTVGPVGPSTVPQQSQQFANNSMFMANAGNFVQNAFPIGVTMTPQATFGAAPGFQMMQPHQHNLFMQQPNPTFVNNGTNPFLQTQATLPNFVQNGTAPLVPTVSAQQFTPEQLAAAFAQQQIAQSAAPTPFDSPPPSMPSTSSGPSGALAPPPPPSHPIPRRVSGNGWPEENKENGTSTSTTNGAQSVPAAAGTDDPVWVLRDSYLKKMQREQRTSEEEEMSWQEAATAAQEAAENGGGDDQEEQETDRLLNGGTTGASTKGAERRGSVDKKKNSKETMVHEPAVLIEGVLFRARYLGSTQMLCESRGSKAARMAQAQEAVARVKAPEGDVQPSTEIDLFISTEKIMVLNTDLQRISDTDVRQDILMDHALRTISYIADIGDLVVLMARRMSTSHSDESCSDGDSSGGGVRKTPKVICHVFESDEASFIAQSIGQAFQVAYVEFLRANGIDDPSYLRQIDYQEVLNSQELLGDELEMFAKKETQKEVVVPKKAGEPLGIVVVESGWGSMLPTVVLAHMNPVGPAAHSNKLNIGDQIININGISLVGLPLSAAQTQIKNMKTATAVRMTVVSTPPVVEVRIRRPDTKYQLGFSVQNGVICSLLRGGIAERGGIRVGHRIIEINGTSVVAVAHDRIVNMLATAVGEIHMKTMPTSMFRLLTGQEQPQYI